MWSAAKGHSTLGIPASVGKEFVGKDGFPRAAGAIIQAKDGKALFLKRVGGDHAGTWGFPAGMAEGDESPEAAAIRELTEEIAHEFSLQPYHHHLGEDIEFVTHRAAVDAHFIPTLNDEHTAYAWAPLDDPPQPVHPGVAKMLEERRARDEAFEDAYDARIKCGTDEAMAMDYADRVVSLLYGNSSHRTGIAFDRESVRQKTPDGFLRVAKANISMAAINGYTGQEINDVMQNEPGWEMLDPAKIYRLFRDPAELKAAVDSFNNIPVLSVHQEVSADDPKPEIVIGSTGTDASFEDPFLTNSLVIWVGDAIEDIESEEKRELSSAYRYKAEMVPGYYKGEHYDGRMYGIHANHVATVSVGRAGPQVAIGDDGTELQWAALLGAIEAMRP